MPLTCCNAGIIATEPRKFIARQNRPILPGGTGQLLPHPLSFPFYFLHHCRARFCKFLKLQPLPRTFPAYVGLHAIGAWSAIELVALRCK
jgi:hypothetical protein